MIDAGTGTGGWQERHSYQFSVYAYENGPNGFPEYGTGDDVCLGRASLLPGILTYDVAASAPDAASGRHSLADTPEGDYNRYQNTSATITQTFDFTGYGDIRLVFFHHHALYLQFPGDYGYLEVNTGTEWTQLVPEYTNPDFDGAYVFHLGGKTQFRRGEVDLSHLAGQPSVQLRFRLSANSANHDDGWCIDDVRLLADGAILFFDDFESGTDDWSLEGSWGVTPDDVYDPDLGTIDPSGLYRVNPVPSPVPLGVGVGYNLVHATYTEGGPILHAYARVYHTSPVYSREVVDFGMEDMCEVVAVDDVSAPIHDRLVLEQNAPNPFNPSTRIAFRLREGARADLRVYDERGRLVRSLLSDAELGEGEHDLTWDGRNDRVELMASGVYFYQLEAGGQRLSRRMILVR
jgi:hypothetical protein